MHGAYKSRYFAISKCPSAFAITVTPLGEGPEGVREVGVTTTLSQVAGKFKAELSISYTQNQRTLRNSEILEFSFP